MSWMPMSHAGLPEGSCTSRVQCQMGSASYRGCAKWEYVQLEYDEHTKLLTVKPIGTRRLRRGMGLMAYGPSTMYVHRL